MLETIRYGDEHVAAYATVRDFCKTFAEELDGLYLLSLLLTGDNDKAEQCVLYALEECADETGVFRQCVSSWTRLAIIRHAIQMIRPVPGRWDSFSIISLEGTVASAENNPFAAIRALGAFERFVFVMSILEGWSEQANRARSNSSSSLNLSNKMKLLVWPFACPAISHRTQELAPTIRGRPFMG